MSIFPYEVKQIFVWPWPKPRSLKHILPISSNAQIMHYCVLFLIIRYYLLKKKYFSKEIISVTDS